MCQQVKKDDKSIDTRFVEQEKTESSQEPTESEFKLFVVKSLQGGDDKSIGIDLTVNSVPMCMELDTGADVNLLSENTWRDRAAKRFTLATQ